MQLNVDGLVSGLDTSSIITQLMQLERQPQVRLQQRRDSQNSVIGLYQTLNTRFKAIQTAAEKLAAALDWNVRKATSSNEDLAKVTVGSGAVPGSSSFRVTSLVATHTLISAGSVSDPAQAGYFTTGNGPLSASSSNTGVVTATAGAGATAGNTQVTVNAVAAAHTLTSTGSIANPAQTGQFSGGFRVNGVKVDNVGDGSLNGVVSGINAANTGVTASVVQSSPGAYKLLLTRNVNGAAGTFSVTGNQLSALGTVNQIVTQGTDASVTANGVTRTGTSNTFTNVINGVTLNLVSASASPVTVSVTPGPDVTVNGVNITDVGDGSLNALAAAITASDAGVVGSVVQTGANAYKLLLTSKTAGATGTFTASGGMLSQIGGTSQIVTQGADATVQVGTTNPYTVTSTTNNVTGLMPGVTLNLVGADATKTVTVDVTTDADAIATRIEELVKAVNDAAAFIRSNSTYDQATKKAGAFLSDQVTSRLGSSLLNAITSSIGGSAISASSAGITTDRNGVVSFDKAKFLASYAADPAALQAAFTTGSTATTTDDGIAERLRLLAKSATDIGTGTISLAIESRTARSKSLDTQIANWDQRLALKEKALRRQFSSLESLLGTAQSQGNWLASQIASLPKISS